MIASVLDAREEEEDRNLEPYCLIWLDASMNYSEENLRAQQYLRTSINYLLIFQDHRLCLQFIDSLSIDDQAILIVSHQLGSIIIPQITQLRRIISIYKYSTDKKVNEHWTQNFPKVKIKYTKFSFSKSNIFPAGKMCN
jgi:hypothetical protein